MVARGRIGGSSNELGSWHRAGIAAYLAVHGLVDQPVAGFTDAVPVSITLEADEPTDDVVATMRDSTQWFIQCKRTAGNDRNLHSTIEQWAEQTLGLNDRVVLASRTLKGLLKDLQQQINRAIRQESLGSTAQTSIDTFIAQLRKHGVEEPNSLLGRIQLLEWRVEEPGDPEFTTATAMLAGTIVSASDATAAFGALRSRMQLAATRSETTGPHDWIKCLSDAQLTVYSDGEGPSGARLKAQQQALSSYRAQLASRVNRLNVSALSLEVSEIEVQDALGPWEVSWQKSGNDRPSETSVMNVVRGTSRFIVSGLPGMGKTELSRQIAARLAADDSAPIPIRIDLRDVLAQIGASEDLTLDTLLSRPARSVTGCNPEVLKTALTEATLSGNSILLVDGLDEAQRASGKVASGLKRLSDQIHPGTGLILTTRHSALPAAKQLKLPVVDLKTPGSVKQAMIRLIEAIAPSYRDNGPEQDEWVTAKTQALTAAMETHDDVWNVPLLATLATGRIIKGDHSARSAVTLLNEVIKDSVDHWELNRANAKDVFSADLRTEMLHDGFTAIGHALIGSASLAPTEALTAVRTSLVPWNLGPRRGEIVANEILRFWDDHVGIFVNSDGAIVPRSRQFAELAEVHWVTEQGKTTRSSWLLDALYDDTYSHLVALTASLDPEVRELLIRQSSRTYNSDLETRRRAVTWVARNWSSWPDINETQQCAIVNGIADAADDQLLPTSDDQGFFRQLTESRIASDGGGWEFVLALLHAPRGGAPDQLRRHRLVTLSLDDSRRTIVQALEGLIEAEHRDTILDQSTIDAVRTILTWELPEAPKSFLDERNVLIVPSGESHITGVGEIAERSTLFLEQLGTGAPNALYGIARRQVTAQSDRIKRKLAVLGFPDPNPRSNRFAFPETWSKLAADENRLGWLLRPLEEMYPAPELKGDSPSWRYPELGALTTVMEHGQWATSDHVAATRDSPDVLKPWIAAHIKAYGLDGALASQQARHFRNAEDSNDVYDSIQYGRLETSPTVQAIGQATALSLVPTFASQSEWVVSLTYRLLTLTPFPEVASALSQPTEPATWPSTYLRTLAIIHNSRDQLGTAQRLGRNQSAVIRAAVGKLLSTNPQSDPALLSTLQSDQDAEVRHHSGGLPLDAKRWTCRRCVYINPANIKQCENCEFQPSWR